MPTSPRRASIAPPAPKLGLIFVAPDTSPRGEGVPDDPRRLGLRPRRRLLRRRDAGAVVAQLPDVDLCHRGAAGARRGRIPGRHGPAGHLRPFDGRPRRADRRAAQSRPLPQRLGLRADRRAERRCRGARRRSAAISATIARRWRKHDAVALIEDGARLPDYWSTSATADPFLEKELKPELLEQACAEAGIPLHAAARSPATTTAIISSRPSWPTICAGTRSGWPRHCRVGA